MNSLSSKTPLCRIALDEEITGKEYFENVKKLHETLCFAVLFMRDHFGFNVFNYEPPPEKREMYGMFRRVLDILGFYNLTLISLGSRMNADPDFKLRISAIDIDALEFANTHLDEFEQYLNANGLMGEPPAPKPSMVN